MKKIIAREMRIMLVAALIGFVAASFVTYTRAYAENTQNEIAQNVIRLHVMANSNSTTDQELKYIVQEGIRDRFGEELNNSAINIDESRQILLANIDEIYDFASRLIRKNGFDYPVEVILGRTFFPTVNYQTDNSKISFPAGEYEALRIIIGEGLGDNWWCVMFPPLCYVDIATDSESNSAESRNTEINNTTTLANLLSEDTYALMNHTQMSTNVTIRFKIVEWWQERMNGESSEDHVPMYVRF